MRVKYGHTTRVGTKVSLRGEGLSIPGLQIWSILGRFFKRDSIGKRFLNIACDTHTLLELLFAIPRNRLYISDLSNLRSS